LSDRKYYKYERSDIKKNISVISFNLGMLWNIDRHIHLETYGGLGFKKVTVRHQLTNPVEWNEEPFYEWLGPPKDEQEGKWILPHFDPGMKIGYYID
jgi:hypothetical protein